MLFYPSYKITRYMASPNFESAAELKLKTVVVEDVYQDRPKPSALDIWVQQGGYSA